MFTIECPQCGASSSISLQQSVYEGPLKCWKCKVLFMVKIENGELKLCQPLSQEDFEKWQELQKLLKKDNVE